MTGFHELYPGDMPIEEVPPPPPRLLKLEPLACVLDAPEARWLVSGILAQGATTMLYSSPKSGKTILHLALSKALLSGGQWLDEPLHPINSVWLLSEQNAITLHSQVNFIAYGDHLMENPSLHMLGMAHEQGDPPFTPETLAESLWATYQAAPVKPELIVIDTIGRFLGLEDNNDYMEVTKACSTLNLAFHRMPGTSACLVHHARKAPGDGADRVLGSTALAAAVDILVHLRKGDGKQRKLGVQSRIGTGAVNEEGITIELVLPDAFFIQVQSGEEFEDLVYDSVGAGHHSRAQIAGYLEDAGHSVSLSKVSKAVTQMVADGKLIRTGGGRSSRIYIPEDAPPAFL